VNQGYRYEPEEIVKTIGPAMEGLHLIVDQEWRFSSETCYLGQLLDVAAGAKESL
jgi:hypothetical protein